MGIMKRFFVALSFLVLVAVSVNAQTAPDAAKLTAMLTEFLDGAGRNDAAIHDMFWAEDLIYTRSAGARVGKAELMRGVRSAPPAKPTDPKTVYTAEDVRIQQYGDAAVVAFKLVGTTTRADGTINVTNHLNTGTFIKRKGAWQVVAWQATVVPPPAPAVTKTAEAEPAKPEAKAGAYVPDGLIAPAGATPKRTYQKGPRGGCFYLNASGRKTYVDQKFCT